MKKEKVLILGDTHSSEPMEIELPRGITTIVLDGDVYNNTLVSKLGSTPIKKDLQDLRKELKKLAAISIPFHSIKVD